MIKKQPKTVVCQVCGKQKLLDASIPGVAVRDSLVDLIKHDHPDWTPDGYICKDDLNYYRTQYVKKPWRSKRGNCRLWSKR